MSNVGKLISALAGEDYEAAQKIYQEIEATGTPKEIQNAKYAMSVM